MGTGATWIHELQNGCFCFKPYRMTSKAFCLLAPLCEICVFFFLTSPSAKPKLEHTLRVSAIPLRLSHRWMRCAYFCSRTAYPLVRILQWIVVIITVTESSKQWSVADGIEQDLCIYVSLYCSLERINFLVEAQGMPFTYQNGFGRLSQYHIPQANKWIITGDENYYVLHFCLFWGGKGARITEFVFQCGEPRKVCSYRAHEPWFQDILSRARVSANRVFISLITSYTLATMCGAIWQNDLLSGRWFRE